MFLEHTNDVTSLNASRFRLPAARSALASLASHDAAVAAVAPPLTGAMLDDKGVQVVILDGRALTFSLSF